MRMRVWFIRLVLAFAFTILSLIISFIMNGSLLINYINTSFMTGLFFLTICGITLIIFSGFFNVFALGWKKLFFRDDQFSDKTHWSYDINSKKELANEKQLLRRKVRHELFIYIPLSIAIFLLTQSFLLLYFVK